jgi:putative ABC transport system permease protein
LRPSQHWDLLGVQDVADAPKSAVISETMAKRYFANEEPIGHQLRLGTDASNPWLTVVGVVADVTLDRLTESKPPVVYSPHAQGVQGVAGTMVLAVRTTTSPATVLSAVRREVKALDKELPLAGVTTLEHVVHDARGPARLHTLLLGTFAALALVLAAVGVYGVLAYSVAQQTSEIGVRMAVGATVADIFRLVMGRGARLAALGLAVGHVGALALSRFLGSLLFEVKPFDFTTYGAVSFVLFAAATLATLVPATRAALVDPSVALRYE